MRALELKDCLKELIEQKIPTFIWGSPGIGKSSIVKQIAYEKNLEFIDLRLSLLDPTDLKGIPFFNSSTKEAIWAPPNFLPKDNKSSGILFLDEINSAPPSVQAAAYQLVLDRKVAEYSLPENWAIVAAGNLESDMALTYHMPTALSNRFVHLELEAHIDDWLIWAYSANIDYTICSYLRFDSSKLFSFNPEDDSKAFATPRSWEYVDKILKSKIEDSSLVKILAGTIGEEVAVSFVNFKKVMQNLPNIEDILDGKDVSFSNDSKVLFALITAVAMRLKNATNTQIENVIKFSHKLPKEYAIALIKDIQQNGIDIEMLPAWQEWVEEFAYLLE